MLIDLIFLLWICTAGAEDLIYRKCHNWIIILGLIFLLVLTTIEFESNFIYISINNNLYAGFFIFIVFLIFYLFGVMGAGDVKFATVLAMLVGWNLMLYIWALSCFFAVLHGIFARSNFKYIYAPAINWNDGLKTGNRKFIPYVTYLALATVLVLMLNK
jgi:prepilin peptidase CpaA